MRQMHREAVRWFWSSVGQVLILIGRGFIAAGEWLHAGATGEDISTSRRGQ